MPSKAKTCTRCKTVYPTAAFYRDGSWCDDCRRAERKRWKASNQRSDAAHKMLNAHKNGKANAQPAQYGKAQCEHIASYTKRAIERFERITGAEAPPELTAIYQLAQGLANKQASRLLTRKIAGFDPIECLNCGKTFKPKTYNGLYCSKICYETFKRLANPEAERAKQQRSNERRFGAERRERKAQRADRRQQQQQQRAQAAAAAQHAEEEWQHRATHALELRCQGMKWADVARQAGYASTGAAHNAIRVRLDINPRTIRASSDPPAIPEARQHV